MTRLEQALQLSDNEQTKNLIRSYLLSKQKTQKFDIHSFCKKKDEFRPPMTAVYYQNGLAVASNTYMLIEMKCDYPAEWENKSVKKDGTIVEGEFPHYEPCFPTNVTAVPFDFSRIVEMGKAEKIRFRETKKRGVVRIQKNGFDIAFYIDLFSVFCSAFLDQSEIYFSGNDFVAFAKTETSRGIIMPVYLAKTDSDHIIFY